MSPAILTRPLSTPQQQRNLANVKMYQFCGGHTNYMRISHSHPKPSFTMKTRALSSLLILFREVLAKFLTMLMATFTMVLQMALDVQCIHWHGMIQRRNAWLFKKLQKSTSGQVIDLPTPPDHIIIDVKPQAGTQWPKHLNLAPDSNFIRIMIGLASWCNKKAKVGTQESVTHYAHALDLAFAITVWKCQGGTFEYIIALLEHSPGSSALTFEKLHVMFTQVKEANHFRCLPLSPIYDKQTLFHLRPKILATKWRMDID
jgi:hypothetical protein